MVSFRIFKEPNRHSITGRNPFMKALTPAAAVLLAFTAAPTFAAPLAVSHLRCEYASEPLGIDEIGRAHV